MSSDCAEIAREYCPKAYPALEHAVAKSNRIRALLLEALEGTEDLAAAEGSWLARAREVLK